MANLEVNYLGLKLSSPIIVSSSPFTASVDKIVKLEEAGAGAVVLKSIFEEQIMGESGFLESYNNYPEAADYLKGYIGDDYLRDHLNIISEAKRTVKMPIIASINCSKPGEWVSYAKSIQEAGADAIELNICILPTDTSKSSDDIEKKYLEIISSVTTAVSIPVSAKLGIRFTNILHLSREIYYRNARGVVMFNRFFEPDIDINNMSVVSSDNLSNGSELRNSLRSIAMCSAALPMLDISVSTGIDTSADVVKSLLVGAKSVQICSALYHHGMGFISEANSFIFEWMSKNSFSNISDFCGAMNYKQAPTDEFERVQYMRYFPRQ